jgi:hypothetical protein
MRTIRALGSQMSTDGGEVPQGPGSWDSLALVTMVVVVVVCVTVATLFHSKRIKSLSQQIVHH